ncbi:MAG TPA: hypothetical protein VHC86_02715 [Opitutaceae bacterium]|nr:hypothetical protein [Opitutaceae bacterium]
MKPGLGAMIGLLGIAGCGGCRHAPTGSASASFVSPAGSDVPLRDARELKLAEPMDVFVDAKPIGPLAMPRYPARALAAGAGAVTVRVDITVSAEGQVTAVARDALDLSGLGRFREDFFEAVQAAVQSWRFEPAAIERLEPSPYGRPVIVGITPQERGYVVEFRFTEAGRVSRSITAH